MNAHPSSGSEAALSTADLDQQALQTRGKLDRTLDELQSRLSPRARLGAAFRKAREVGGEVTRTVIAPVAPDVITMIRLDHTHVLAVFRRFRPTISRARKEALATNACLALEIHAQLEEEILYPALRQIDPDNQFLAKSEPEHEEMRELIAELRGLRVTDSTYDETLQQLMRAVLHHVADEESVILPLAQRSLGPRLAELGWQMTRRRVELLRPHLATAARTSAQAFPVATGVLAAGLLILGCYMARALISLGHDRDS